MTTASPRPRARQSSAGAQANAAQIAAAIAAASVSNTRDSDGVAKAIAVGICGLIGAITLALFLWVGTSINDLSKSVTLMSANVDNLQKSITELQQGQGATSKTTSDLGAQVAAGGARATAIEQDVGRIKERIRMLEGQPPVRQ